MSERKRCLQWFSAGLISSVLISSVAILIVLKEATFKQESVNTARQIAVESMYATEVLRVVDGDTVDVEFEVFKDIILRKRIRLAGINAPEVRGDEREAGLKAKAWLIQKLNAGNVYVLTDGSTDKYGRLLGTLFLVGEEHINLNNKMVEEGFAVVYE